MHYPARRLCSSWSPAPAFSVVEGGEDRGTPSVVIAVTQGFAKFGRLTTSDGFRWCPSF
jgi:hypothetical protein